MKSESKMQESGTECEVKECEIPKKGLLRLQEGEQEREREKEGNKVEGSGIGAQRERQGEKEEEEKEEKKGKKNKEILANIPPMILYNCAIDQSPSRG